MSYQILRGDCLAVLRTLPDNSFDSIVTDPPYELGFMGKAWDASGIANSVEMWREALRVLKPGGHLLAFSGSRTYHRMTCAIEDAGFEVRDQIMWLYGSGFPKSLDVSKAIDKMDATEARRVRQLRFTEWMRGTGLSSARIDEITSMNMGGHYTTAASQPAVATRDHLEALRPYITATVPDWVEEMVDERSVESENYKSREVLAVETRMNEPSGIVGVGQGERVQIDRKITAAHTDAARQWEGWGTALKPAHEPICVARKPLIGTVAANVLAHGTGALNIDGCRVESPGEDLTRECLGHASAVHEGYKRPNHETAEKQVFGSTDGRWPANLIHDGGDDVYRGFDLTSEEKVVALCADCGDKYQSNHAGCAWGWKKPNGQLMGNAARFFYCAKASKSDRGPGNTHPTVKPLALMRYLLRLVTPPGGRSLDIFAGSGSTIVAGLQEGFIMTGIELTPEYADIAEARAQEEYLGDLI